MEKQTLKSIRQQIFSGYILVIILTSCLVITSLISLYVIYACNQGVERNRDNQALTQAALVSHYQWLDDLGVSIQTGAEFTGSLDPTTCSLGKWVAEASAEDLRDNTIRQSIDHVMDPHQMIHTRASDLLELAESNPALAYQHYADEVRPQVAIVIEELGMISGRYKALGDGAADLLRVALRISIAACVLLGAIIILLSLLCARRISKRISVPIVAVAEWSKQLAAGEENLDFGSVGSEDKQAIEINLMIDSFTDMAQSIHHNASVVKRIADGDMTAFVNIRSREDSLGKSLYHLVQSNDLMFAKIINIAQTVASGSEQIAAAGQALANNASVQSDSVQNLSETINQAGNLIEESAKKTHVATEISREIKVDSQESDQRMKELVSSVEDIRRAANGIESVIKSIEDIAFQTNILALNASIEAARAGNAGKGFAVVADEVRELALKSGEAAKESRALIETTINKTESGNEICTQAAAVFDKISYEIDQIVNIISEIYQASNSQLEGIELIRSEIGKITDVATNNAAASEESAATSQEMSGNAELLRQEMSRFHLRKREQGQPYIPPEKEDDSDFIEEAYKNYQKAMKTGYSELADVYLR